MKVSLPLLLTSIVALIFTGCATHEAHRAPQPHPLPPPTVRKPTPLPAPATVRRPAPSTPPVVVARKPTTKAKSTQVREIVVTQAPPKPLAETAPKIPTKGYAWIPGAWIWRGHWVWSPGHWVVPPHATAVWNPPRYSYRNGKHYWTQGTWRG